MGLQEALTTEISRVVSCQYAVSLKHLHALLRDSDATTIRRWASGNPCQIPKLAAAVEEALQTWPYALEILRKLVQAKSFRDAFLQQHPTILEAFLGKATSAHCTEEIFDTCVALLTEPLPDTIPLPASAQKFLIDTFKKATGSPTERRYGLVYTLLDGACRHLVGVLPRDTWDQFQDYNWELLKRKDLDKYTTVATLCCGISASLAQPQSKRLAPPSCRDGHPSSTPAALTSSEDHLALPRLFGADRGRSMTRLMVGNAMVWCGEGAASSDDAVVRNMRIAGRVVSLVPEDVRLSWSRDHSLWTDKFLGKVLQTGIHPVLQLEGLTLLGLLHRSEAIPARAVSAYEKVLLHVARMSPNLRTLGETVSLSLGLYSPQLDDSFAKSVLREVISSCAQPSLILDQLEALNLLVQYLDLAATDSKNVRRGILLAMSADDLAMPLQEFIASPTPTLAIHDTVAACTTVVKDAVRRAGLALCSIILKSALVSQADEMGLSVSIGMSLLETQQKLAVPLPTCPHEQRSRLEPPTLSLIQEARTQATQAPSRDWRQRLAADLQKEDFKRAQLIQRTMDEVCRDLEVRCQENEGPWRQEQKKAMELTKRLDALEKENAELSAHASELESRGLDRELFTEGLESEKNQAQDELARFSTLNENLEDKVESLKRKLKEVNQSAESTLASVRTNYDNRLSEIRAALASEENNSHARMGDIVELKQKEDNLEQTLKSANEQLALERDACRILRENLTSVENELEHHKATILQKETELDKAFAENQSLSEETQALKASMSQSHADHEQTISSLRVEMQQQASCFEERLGCSEEEVLKVRTALAEQLSTASKELDGLRTLYDSTSEELRERNCAISKLQHKIQKLSDAYDEKEAQVQEAEAFKTRILSAMGSSVGAFEQSEKTSRRRRTRHSAGPATQTPRRSSRGTQRVVDDEFASQENGGDTPPPDSLERSSDSGGSAKDGRTPKRAKSHTQPFKIPSIRPAPGGLRSAMASQGRLSSAAQRTPLVDVSTSRGNLSPVRRKGGMVDSAAKTVLFEEKPEFLAESQREGVDDMEDESFGGSDLFTSTPFVSQGVAACKPSEFDGDTTTDS